MLEDSDRPINPGREEKVGWGRVKWGWAGGGNRVGNGEEWLWEGGGFSGCQILTPFHSLDPHGLAPVILLAYEGIVAYLWPRWKRIIVSTQTVPT